MTKVDRIALMEKHGWVEADAIAELIHKYVISSRTARRWLAPSQEAATKLLLARDMILQNWKAQGYVAALDGEPEEPNPRGALALGCKWVVTIGKWHDLPEGDLFGSELAGEEAATAWRNGWKLAERSTEVAWEPPQFVPEDSGREYAANSTVEEALKRWDPETPLRLVEIDGGLFVITDDIRDKAQRVSLKNLFGLREKPRKDTDTLRTVNAGDGSVQTLNYTVVPPFPIHRYLIEEVRARKISHALALVYPGFDDRERRYGEPPSAGAVLAYLEIKRQRELDQAASQRLEPGECDGNNFVQAPSPHKLWQPERKFLIERRRRTIPHNHEIVTDWRPLSKYSPLVYEPENDGQLPYHPGATEHRRPDRRPRQKTMYDSSVAGVGLPTLQYYKESAEKRTRGTEPAGVSFQGIDSGRVIYEERDSPSVKRNRVKLNQARPWWRKEPSSAGFRCPGTINVRVNELVTPAELARLRAGEERAVEQWRAAHIKLALAAD